EIDGDEILVASELIASNDIFAFENFGVRAEEINFEKNAKLIRTMPQKNFFDGQQKNSHENFFTQNFLNEQQKNSYENFFTQNFFAQNFSNEQEKNSHENFFTQNFFANSYAQNFVSGTVENIIVLITFSCDPDPTIAPALIAEIENKFNGEEFSLRDYMHVASGGTLTVNSTVLGTDNDVVFMYRDEKPRAYFQPYNAVTNPIGYEPGDVGETDEGHERGQKLLARAIRALDGSTLLDGKILDTIREGFVDSTTFMVSGAPGAWASFLWPHKWYLYMDSASLNGKKIGEYCLLLSGTEFSFSRSVIVHEQKHIFGAPDFYRYGSPTRIGATGTPVGLWDIMSNNSDAFFQFSNTHVARKYFGWGSAPEIIFSDGNFFLHPLGTKNKITSYAIPIKNRPHEFILIEYRNANNSTIYDNFPETGWYGSGLTVSRVNLLFHGNARSGDVGFQDGDENFRDEVYYFRPNTTVKNAATNDVSQAALGGTRTAFGDANATGFSNVIYSSEGYNTGIEIFDVLKSGETISFGVRLGESNIPPLSPEMILRAEFATATNEPKIIFLNENIILNEKFPINIPSGANITLRGIGEIKTISAGGSHAVFQVLPHANFAIENVKITREPETVGSGIINYGNLFFSRGEICGHESAIKMMLDDLRTAGKIFVGADVIFADNHAEKAFNRAPIDDEIYRAQIFATRWSDPFSQGFNNFDIAYEAGDEAIIREIMFAPFRVTSNEEIFPQEIFAHAHSNSHDETILREIILAPIRAIAGEPIFSAPSFPKNPTKNGDVFEWFFDENFSQPLTENSLMPDDDITIFPRQLYRFGAIADGVNVTSADAAFLARHIAGHAGFELNGDKKIVADLNGDGVVCAKDLRILVRWLVGYDLDYLVSSV
ncbi:MAG: hypothetical protein FWD19_01030, partial [Defluviitaleaceae bacterium]|nr:hypothetical protein [Defluviitaleaceae bacterium]